MKTKLPRITLGGDVPGAAAFNKWIDTIVSAIETAISPSGDGVGVTSSRAGLHFSVPSLPIAVVETASTINARSGATPGTGKINIQMFNGTSFVADSSRQNVDVYNYSSNTTLTPSGKYGIAVRLWGVWWLVVVEC